MGGLKVVVVVKNTFVVRMTCNRGSDGIKNVNVVKKTLKKLYKRLDYFGGTCYSEDSRNDKNKNTLTNRKE